MNKTNQYLLYVIVILVLAALACNAGAAAPTPTPAPAVDASSPEEESPAATEEPAVAPEETEEPAAEEPTSEPEAESPEPTEESADGADTAMTTGDLLYETTFEEGWLAVTSGDDDNGASAPVPGGYQFTIDRNWDHWTYTSQMAVGAFAARVEVEARTCPRGRGGYGILFHYQDDSNFRYLLVTCSGDYQLIERDLPRDSVTLASGDLPASIDTGIGVHTLAVRVQANQVEAFVDGQLIATADLPDMPAGDIGLIVDTDDLPLDVLYTRMEIFEPE